MTRPQRRLDAIVVTYRRPDILTSTLDTVIAQTRSPDSIMVIDNDPDESGRVIAEAVPSVEYVAAGRNQGPAGAIALGMSALLEHANDSDLLLLVDDDDPPPDSTTIERLLQSFEDASETRTRVGGIGLTGARYRRQRGDFIRVCDGELSGFVSVDYFGGGQCPIYAIRAIRDVGVFDESLFFGFEEADFGLRLRSAGWELLVPGEYWAELRERNGRVGIGLRPRSSEPTPPWRQYYSSRNAVHLARRFGTRRAVVETVLRGLVLTPLNRLIRQRSPSGAAAAVRGSLSGILGERGRVVEPS